jgi:hypothetical protein
MTTPPPDLPHNHSVQLLLREHERLSRLYSENREIGERRVSLFVSLLTFAVSAAGFIIKDDISLENLVTPINLAILFVPMFVGWVTFIRLVERRIEAIELLRGINRIHSYFTNLENKLQDAISWQANPEKPTFADSSKECICWASFKAIFKLFKTDDSRLRDIPGLRAITQVLNSLLIGLMMAAVIEPYLNTHLLLFGALLAAVLLLFAQSWLYHYLMIKAQRKADKQDSDRCVAVLSQRIGKFFKQILHKKL